MRPNLIDDTGKHLLLAQRGDQAAAADAVLRTVHARLALYSRSFGDHLAASAGEATR